ncbi:helix-turn-helix domain-containing protein [Modestobacter excelsi]|uniref:helix-turn-helix domain-containing protein n=1 Tax=Modestobacter excelsi TaxID=2213161 RepID=UPI00110CA874
MGWTPHDPGKVTPDRLRAHEAGGGRSVDRGGLPTAYSSPSAQPRAFKVAAARAGIPGAGLHTSLLTPEEAARVLRVGRTTVYTLMRIGELRPVHIGRSCRLSLAELLRYVDRLETPSEADEGARIR